MAEMLSFYSELEKVKKGQGNIAIVHQRSGTARIIYEAIEFGNDVVKLLVSAPESQSLLDQVTKGITSPHFREVPQEILLAYTDIASLQILKDIG